MIFFICINRLWQKRQRKVNARRIKLLGILNSKNLSIKPAMNLNTNLGNFHLFQSREYN